MGIEQSFRKDPEELTLDRLNALKLTPYADEPAPDNIDYVIPKRLQEVGFNVAVDEFEVPEYPGRPIFRVSFGDIPAMVAYACVTTDYDFRKVQRDMIQGRPGNYAAKLAEILNRLHPLPQPGQDGL